MVLSTTPTVSIILPVYNSARYLRESIDSVLRQDYSDYELIIINDGSTDESQTIIDHYAALDSRIVSIRQENIGLVATLNKAIGLAKGQYIARIDGDDPWFDGKLQAQIEMLESDPKLVLIGGGFEIIDENGFFIETITTPTSDADIRRTLLLRNAFGHAAVVFTKEAFMKAGGYSSDVGPAEDYDLWVKFAGIGKLANLPLPIYRYRINRKGISQQNSEAQATHTKLRSDAQWAKTTPVVLSRQQIISRSNEYLKESPVSWYGVALKEQYLADNTQIGIKLIRYKKIKAGFVQLWNVASTGRSGIRALKKRLGQLRPGSLKQSREPSIGTPNL